MGKGTMNLYMRLLRAVPENNVQRGEPQLTLFVCLDRLLIVRSCTVSILWPHPTQLVHTTCIRELHLLALIQNVLYSIRKAPKLVQPGLPRECKDRTPDIILSVISQPSAHYRPYRSQATILRRRQSCWPREQKPVTRVQTVCTPRYSRGEGL